LNQLVRTYKSLGDYYILDAKNSQTIGTNCCQQTEIMYEKADPQNMDKIEAKRRKAASYTQIK